MMGRKPFWHNLQHMPDKLRKARGQITNTDDIITRELIASWIWCQTFTCKNSANPVHPSVNN